MKKFIVLLFGLTFAMNVTAGGDEPKEKPTQHLKLEDVSSLEQAKNIFIEKTLEIGSKDNLNPTELSEIHISTYSLEKSVAYFVDTLEGDRQALAKEIAVLVEDIHIASERNQGENVKIHLDNYFKLAEKFSSGF